MIDPKILDDIAEKISSVIPDGLTSAEASFKKHVRQCLMGVFERLDLVTREEFDVQKKVLERTRQKVDVLEKIIEQAEKSKS